MKYVIPFLIILLSMSCKHTPETNENEESKSTSAVWNNKVIYEVNVRQFSEEGTFTKVTEQLDRLKNMGVDILWLMPIHPIGEKNRKGSMGSYYAVKDYKGVNPEMGTLDDFQQLIDTAHEKGMYVIIDWVANHSSPDNNWVQEHLDYYTKDSLGNAPIPTVGTDWHDVADLNYDNENMRKAMADAMMYWVKEVKVDGFRCDVAEMVPTETTNFWKEVIPQLRKENENLFMLAEGADPELFDYGFDMIYGWPFKHLIVEIGKGNKPTKDILKYRDTIYNKLQDKDLIMYFTTNHDENSWNYIESEVFGKNYYNYLTLTITMGGMPLLYSGQESGLEKKLEFFEKDPIEWGNYKHADYITHLYKVYKENSVLWGGADKGKYQSIETKDKDILAFTLTKEGTENVLVVLNMSATDYTLPKEWQKNKKYTSELVHGGDVSSNKEIVVPAHTSYIISYQ